MATTTNKGIRIVGNVLEWLVFVALLVVLTIIASPLLPTKNSASFYVIVSGSMEPKIPTGSLILVKSADVRNLHKDDVIAFTSPDHSTETITHRIYSVSHKFNTVSYKTKGDANDAPDVWIVQPEMIKGAYSWHVPYVGYAIEWAKTPVGFAVVIGVPALLFVVMQIKKIRQGINEEVEKRTKKALHQAESSTPHITTIGPPDSHGRILSLALALSISTALMVASTSPAQALFSSQVKIKGITLQVASTNSPCPAGSLWPAEFNNPPYSTMGVSSWKDSWLNGSFDWDAFWAGLGIPAPKACTIPVAPNPFPTMPPMPTMPPFPTGFTFVSPTPCACIPTSTPTISPTPIESSQTPTITPTTTPTPLITPQSTQSALPQ